MSQAKSAADEDNVSVNQLLVALIAEGLGHRRGLQERGLQEKGLQEKGLQDMRTRASRADVAAALAILDHAPDVPAEPGDALRSGS
ncbi:hypothetical protein [Methylobacterium sp. BTF04]|uniref:hypothetical protein n=1 Tax=Methylobacterium sp. BTF04 TaxID=2708300 RepID=UPI001FEE5784|nr:hypothetical protein [Methylobacterium sp. BTF04]